MRQQNYNQVRQMRATQTPIVRYRWVSGGKYSGPEKASSIDFYNGGKAIYRYVVGVHGSFYDWVCDYKFDGNQIMVLPYFTKNKCEIYTLSDNNNKLTYTGGRDLNNPSQTPKRDLPYSMHLNYEKADPTVKESDWEIQIAQMRNFNTDKQYMDANSIKRTEENFKRLRHSATAVYQKSNFNRPANTPPTVSTIGRITFWVTNVLDEKGQQILFREETWTPSNNVTTALVAYKIEGDLIYLRDDVYEIHADKLTYLGRLKSDGNLDVRGSKSSSGNDYQKIR